MNVSDKNKFNKEFARAMTFSTANVLFKRVENRVNKKQMSNTVDDILIKTGDLLKSTQR